jgi:PAS domain S-box-containing protein
MHAMARSKPTEKMEEMFHFERFIAESKSAMSELLMRHIPVNVFLADVEGYIVWGNQRMLDTLGLSMTEFKGKHLSQWDVGQQWQFVIKKTCEQVVEEQGGGAWYLCIRKPLFTNDGKVIGLLGVSLDITEQKQAEIAKRQFIENMQHDLRTPFSGVYGLAQMLYEQATDPEQKKILHYILASAKQWMNVINQLLDFNRLEKQAIKLEYFDVHTLIQNVTDFFCSKLRLKNISLSINAKSILIYSDKFKMYHILVNLMSNAVNFTHKGSITISVVNQPYLSISIEDTGIGVAAEHYEEIFKQFTKLKVSNSSAEFTGCGNGLYFARQYAQQLGGDIHVESVLGQGSKFTFYINK